jgi:hypothetical protein
MVGTVLGIIGHRLGGKSAGGNVFYVVGIWAMIIAAREWKWITFPLPESKHQTERTWVQQFGFLTAAVMWGLDIGFGFGTRIKYGGFWVLIAVALAFGDPLYSAVLMISYWFGRVLPLWVAPLLVRTTSDAMALPGAVLSRASFYHQLTGWASFGLAGIALVVAMHARDSLSWAFSWRVLP